tara:strand:+ start:214 stop:507 length:294 start_codon:yes stop_codon:yes gene_type:complete
MHSKLIYLNTITYKVIPYGKRNGVKVLLDKKYILKTERHISIGKTIEDLKDTMYNDTLHKKLHNSNSTKTGCEIEIIEVVPISDHGFTNARFEGIRE